ncbi:MAG: hypothetical protein ACU0BB_11715, partial [Paracoccaceae bacterium]
AQVHCATFDALAPKAELTHIVRSDWLSRAQTGIDRQLRAEITAAVQNTGGPVLMAYCLQSTVEPSKALLRRAFGETPTDVVLLDLGNHWDLFTAGDTSGFAEAIAQDIAQALKTTQYACVVLAQASMAGAADVLNDVTDVPVLASPRLAVTALLSET